MSARTHLGSATFGGDRDLISAADHYSLSSWPLDQRVSTNPHPLSLPLLLDWNASNGPDAAHFLSNRLARTQTREPRSSAFGGEAARGFWHERPRTSLATAVPSPPLSASLPRTPQARPRDPRSVDPSSGAPFLSSEHYVCLCTGFPWPLPSEEAQAWSRPFSIFIL